MQSVRRISAPYDALSNRRLRGFRSSSLPPPPALLQPVDVEQALGKKPRAISLCESVEVAERGDHQAPLSALCRDVMREAVGFPCGAVSVQGEDGALSDEMRRGVVSVQVCEDWSERLARVQLLGRLRILGVHIHHEMGVRGEQRHLTSRIATIRAASIGLDELTNSKAVRGFLWGDSDVLAHQCFLRPRGWRGVRETPRSRTGHILGLRRSI